MAKLSPQFWLDVETVLDEKLVELQARAFTELAELPEATGHGYAYWRKRCLFDSVRLASLPQQRHCCSSGRI